MVFAEILGPDMLIIIGIIVLLFGSSQLPKIARSLGSAKSEFEKGVREAHANAAAEEAKPAPKPESAPAPLPAPESSSAAQDPPTS